MTLDRGKPRYLSFGGIFTPSGTCVASQRVGGKVGPPPCRSKDDGSARLAALREWALVVVAVSPLRGLGLLRVSYPGLRSRPRRCPGLRCGAAPRLGRGMSIQNDVCSDARG